MLKLDWCSHEAAKYAVEKWHYSGSMPSPYTKPLKIGVWEDGRFIGTVIFTAGSSSNLAKPYGILNTEACELQRVSLSRHISSVSRIVAIALRMLKQECPRLRIVVSFADPGEGHVGGIYQAGNWVYSGLTAQSRRYYDKRGVQRHERNVKATAYTDRNGVVNYARSDMARIEILPGKHRYLMPLDDAMRKQIEPLRKPYPKRPCVRSVDSDTPADQAGEGGATPTRTL